MILLTITACSDKTDAPWMLSKEGIAPYELTERETYLLQSFGMKNSSQIISFHAPKEAVSLDVNIYRLNSGQVWESIGGGAISIGADRLPTDQLTGTFTMHLKENYAIDFNINASGRASFTTEELSLDIEAMASTKYFLQEFQNIELNTEIPVALMVYDSGSTMKSYNLGDYFEPSRFDDMELVQVVTLNFS